MEPKQTLQDFLARSRQVYSAAQVQDTVKQLAQDINKDLADQELVLLCVMNGAVPLTAALMPLLSMPLQVDYIHATRYGDKLQGGALEWVAVPRTSLQDKTVLVVDDIFDEGHTLQAINRYCLEQQAAVVKTAVLVNKRHDLKVQGLVIDYQGLEVEDEYVFGFGMDCQGWGRNLDAIYALEQQ